MTFAEYLKKIRIEKGFLSRRSFAKHIGVSSAHIGDIEKNKSMPSLEMVFKFAEGLQLSGKEIEEFITLAGYTPYKGKMVYKGEEMEFYGSGPLYHKNKGIIDENNPLVITQEQLNKTMKDAVMTATATILEETYGHNIGDHGLLSLKQDLNKIKKHLSINEEHSIYNLPGVKKISESPPLHKVPLVSKINCGDTIAIALATDSTEYIDCPAIAGKADFAFTVRGNSMENYGIYDGDLVYCKETPEFFSGQTVVLSVQENGESFLVCKKAIGKTFVNGKGEIFECEDRSAYGKCNCRIVGVVLAVLGKPL